MTKRNLTHFVALCVAVVIVLTTIVSCTHNGNTENDTTHGTQNNESVNTTVMPNVTDTQTDNSQTDPANTVTDTTGEDVPTVVDPETTPAESSDTDATTEPDTTTMNTTEVDTTAEPNETTAKPTETTKTPETTKKPEETTIPPKDTGTTGHTHSYNKTTTVKPTCAERGYTIYTCKSCGDSYTEYVNANGHTYESNNPTPQVHGFTCSTCGKNLAVSGETCTESCVACGKDVVCNVKDSTCTAKGSFSYTCKSCGYKYSYSVPKTLHKATCFEHRISDTEGVIIYTCQYCGVELMREKMTLVPDNFDKKYWEKYAEDYANSLGFKIRYMKSGSWEGVIAADAHRAANGGLATSIRNRIDNYIAEYELANKTLYIWWEDYGYRDGCDTYKDYGLYIGFGEPD